MNTRADALEADHDDQEPDISSSLFWFDQFSIPQYDWLVKDGRVTQEQADEYRKQREQMGLPMDFDNLQPRPIAAFAWLYEAGGPVVTRNHESFELNGDSWRSNVYGEHGHLELYGASPYSEHGSSKKFARPYTGTGVSWYASSRIGENTWARVSGKAENFATAYTALQAVEFEPIKIGPFDFYPNETQAADKVNLVAAVDGEALVVRSAGWNSDPGRSFQWELTLPEKTVPRRIAACFGQSTLSGYAATKEIAVADAMGAIGALKNLCAELLGDDSFAAGYEAGQGATKAQLMKFLVSEPVGDKGDAT